MPQGGGQNAGGQGGDYQRYMDYQKYMSKGGKSGGGQSGDYTKYYQKYMAQGSGKNTSETTIELVATSSLPHTESAGDYSKFYQDYVPHVKNWSNRDEVNAAFMGKYASSYARSPSPAKPANASTLVSAPALVLAASNDVADVQTVPETSHTSSASSSVPLDGSVATETAAVSKTSSRSGWQTSSFLAVLFLAVALPAAGVTIRLRKSHESIDIGSALTSAKSAFMNLPLLRRLHCAQAADDMTGYRLQAEEDNGYGILV